MSIKGLEQAIANLNRISQTAAPRAVSQAINRVASRAVSRSASRVAKEVKVKRKLVKERARLRRASPANMVARIRVNRGDLPAIKLGPVRMQLSRRKGAVGRAGSVLKVGNRSYDGAFVQQLNNGRWQILRRLPEAKTVDKTKRDSKGRLMRNRLPLEVIKIPMAEPLTAAFKEESSRLLNSDMPKELSAALKNQIRLEIKR